MNKRIVGKLTKIADRYKVVTAARGKKALEDAFSSKTIAIVKYRVGLDDGDFHEVRETAEHFGVSESWVCQAQTKVEKFLFGKTSLPKQKKVKEQVTKEARLICAGVFNIHSGELRIEAETSEIKAELEEGFKRIITQVQGDRFSKMRSAVAEKARVAGRKANNTSNLAVLMAIVAIVISMVMVRDDISDGLFVSLVFGLLISVIVTITFWVRAVSFSSERRGLLKAKEL